MSYERRDLSICTADGDRLVDPAREVGNTILKVMKCDLHDVYRESDISAFVARRYGKEGKPTRFVLDDGNIWTLREFPRSIAQTVLRSV